ncbi:MAG TPA: Na+/H+ antiporter [Anaerolineales bacterium]|nr:Na+/H+ antiporter [Anaerolineales bacterium]
MPHTLWTLLLLACLLPATLAACATAESGPAASPAVASPPDFSASFTPESPGEEPALDLEEQDPILIVEEIVIALLGIAALVGIAARYLRVPYTVGLVVMGVMLTLLPAVDLNIPPNLILGLLLPPLIFEGAFNLDFDNLRRDLAPILAFAVPGVILVMIVVGLLVTWGPHLPLSLALVFGAVVAAIDPVAVIALFRTMGVPKRLQVILEGESLLNDGTAIVLYGLVIAAAVEGARIDPISGVVDFLSISLGGLLVGFTLGYLTALLVNRIDDYLIETTLTTILAFGSYLIAEQLFGVSGVLAVVAAGLVTGNVGPAGMSPTTRIVLFNFWEYAAFIANSFIFLLIGLQIDLSQLFASWQSILIAILAVLLARALTVYGLAWSGKDIPLRWQHVLNWGGLRGAVSLTLALSLPLALGPARTQIQVMTFGVVLFTLLVQGVTMGKLVRSLKLSEKREMADEYERRHARAVAARAALDHLGSLRRKGLISDHTWSTLSPIMEGYNKALSQAVKEVLVLNPQLEAEELEAARRESLQAQRSTFNTLLQSGVISKETYSELVSEVDAALESPGGSWPETINIMGSEPKPVNRLIAAVIQQPDQENALGMLTKLGFSVTHLPSVGAFLGQRNVTLLIGFNEGREAEAVAALQKSCKKRVEYIATPLEAGPMPFSTPMAVSVGGATVFVFEVDHYEEI